MVDGLGTIDPANLSNSGTFCAPTFFDRKSSVLSLAFAHPRPLFQIQRDSPTRDSARSVRCIRSSIPSSIIICFCPVPVTFKLIPLLVSVMPAPSPAEQSPRGIKRSRTPDHIGNGTIGGDQDDGTCASEEVILSCLDPFGLSLSIARASFHRSHPVRYHSGGTY